MADQKDDEHIEELLSQLQGIFGKLSKADEEEAKGKMDIPRAMPTPLRAPPPSEKPEAPPIVTGDPFALQPPPAQAHPSTPVPTPTPVVPPVQPTPPEPEPTPLPPAPMATPLSPASLDEGTLTTAIFYVTGRENEAQTLKQKAEALTPKFTKVAFKLQVTLIAAYDPKSEWREAAMQQLKQSDIRVFFILGERPMEDAKRRQIQADTEPLHIYFQEVSLPSLEKKAFFTDLLLGLVFFFDTLKPRNPGE